MLALKLILRTLHHFLFISFIGCAVYYFVTIPNFDKNQLPKSFNEKRKYIYNHSPKKSQIAFKLAVLFWFLYMIGNFIFN